MKAERTNHYPYGYVRLVITRDHNLVTCHGEVLEADASRLEVRLSGDGGIQWLPDEEIFLALYGGPLGCVLTPAIVIRAESGQRLCLRLPEEGVQLQGRAYFRVAVKVAVRVQDVPGGPGRTLLTENLSAGGALIADSQPAILGEQRMLAVELPGGALTLRARVVRADGRYVAYEFVGIYDAIRSRLMREMIAIERGDRSRGSAGPWPPRWSAT